MRFKIFLPILFLLAGIALAAPLKFVDHNFSVEIPPGWSAITPQPRETLLAVQSPSKSAKFLVFATNTSLKEHPDAEREARDGVKKDMAKAGYKLDPDQETTIAGVSFVAFTAHMPSGGTLTNYTSNSGDQVYMIRAIANDQDAASDPQLQAAVQSFQLLGPPASPETSGSSFSFNAHAGSISSGLILTTLLAAVIAVVLIRLVMKRRN